MLVWVQFPQWERKRYIKRVVCYRERKTIMLIEDIDYSTAPEITLACSKCHAENGFKTETVFTDMEQLNGFVDEDVFSILHLGLPCPHGGDATEDIVTIEPRQTSCPYSTESERQMSFKTFTEEQTKERMKMGTDLKTYADYVDARDALIDLALGEWDIDSLPEINDQLCELANQAIAAGYGDRIEADRDYLPTQITIHPSIEDAVRAYVKAGETGDIYHDKTLDIYVLDLSDRDLQGWVAYFGLSLWGDSEQPNDVVANMINVIGNLGIVPEAEDYLGLSRIDVVNAKRLTIED